MQATLRIDEPSPTQLTARQLDIAVIERDAIRGQASYAAEIRDMHFGPGAVCRTVTRAKWTPTTQERGLVYCEDGQCILVPTVCRNVSRSTGHSALIAPGWTGGVATASALSSKLSLN